jgi:multisubunit Na+/H+ antiporter MnhG subunit
MGHDVALALVSLGTALVVASAVGALATGPNELRRVHFLAPVTSLGAPIAGAGVCVAEGWGLASCEIALILFVLFVTGPVLSAATGRLIAQEDGILGDTGPE